MATTGTTKAASLPKPTQKTDLEPAPIFDVTKLSDERTQTLRKLLEKGHITVAPLREPKLLFHSHLPHLLGSAYGLGADSKQLTESYEHEVSTLIPLDEGEGFLRGDKISKENWREHLQQKPYTVAFVDFFDEEVKKNGGNWQKVLGEYLYSGPEPLINGYIGGLGHPFIHLAYAYEFQSKEVASQALSLGCTEYDRLHALLDHDTGDNSTYKSKSLLDVIARVRDDKRFDGLLTDPGIVNLGVLFEKRFPVFTEHWNAWEVADPVQTLEQVCDVSVLLAISTGDAELSFDFFLAHVMTVAHALRVIWHYFPEERRASILRQYAIFTISLYITQFRLAFGMEKIESVDLEGRDWDWVTEKSLKHKWALDSHFFKVVRALKAFAETYGEKDGFYLKAAVKFITQFRGWEGFGLPLFGFHPGKDGYNPE